MGSLCEVADPRAGRKNTPIRLGVRFGLSNNFLTLAEPTRLGRPSDELIVPHERQIRRSRPARIEPHGSKKGRLFLFASFMVQ